MFDNNVFLENSCRNVNENNQITGFELKTFITYYRGIPLSMVNDIQVFVNGVQIPRENLRLSPDQGQYWFTLDEMETVTGHKWEYNIPMTVLVLQEGGLPAGEHQVKLVVNVRTAYIPVPLVGEQTRTVVMA